MIDHDAMSLSAQELSAISIAERVCSAFSLLGTSIVVVTFLASRSFRKPINRLVFYASWGNIMTNIATLVSQSGIRAGSNSCLCRFQAFFIQWFMPANALWAFAMACNVHLTFFHKYDVESLRRIEWKYLLACYGLPFIPAFSYFFIETKERGSIYGSATLWCWIAPSWGFLRIALFYGPVWFIISLTMGIYTWTGAVIYQKRRQLHKVDGSIDLTLEIGNPFDPSSSSEVTELRVPHEMATAKQQVHNLAHDSVNVKFQPPSKPLYSPYLVTVEAGGGFEKLSGEAPKQVKVDQLGLSPQRRAMVSEADSAAWAYTKYAMLLFVALLVTWVPSTANRVYAWARPDDVVFDLNFVSSFVLPLQGFWNSIIYVSISWQAVKTTVSEFRNNCILSSGEGTKRKLSISPRSFTRSKRTLSPQQSRSIRSESTEELAKTASLA